MKKQKRGRETAAELLARVQADPAWGRVDGEREAKRQELARRHKLAAAPVIEDLEQAGFSVDSLDELRHTRTTYRAAVPVLLKWLPVVPDAAVKESIVRALSVPWAKPAAAGPLIAEFRNSSDPSSGLKWAIGNALAVVADDTVFSEVSELVRDRRNGKAREMLALALSNMQDPRAVPLLVELLDDAEMAGHAVLALGKVKWRGARPHLERFLDHPKSWVRKEAKRALAKLDKAERTAENP